ncbi:APC family permease [Brasilonema bromeliae SPC951]|uniref:APC family permease n=2 Tax=Bromeliae group (in: Brasilonema) TaxID=3398495 RepID=A0ABX1P9B1_9CYAN|nr:APC family permease [Brasilonema bromeliae SPC951]
MLYHINIIMSIVKVCKYYYNSYCAGISWYIAYKDIQLSTIVMLALEGISIGVILLLGLIVLGKHGFAIDTAQLTLQGTQPGSIVSGLVLAVFSYVGFESATTLGDEAQKPLRNIPRAVIMSTVICGLFFIVLSYIEVLGFQNHTTPLNKSEAPLNDLANLAGVGFFGLVISLGAMVSLFACALATINAGGRILFSMARHNIFHASLGRAHGKNQTPHVAVTLVALVAFLLAASTTLLGVKVLDNYAYFGTIATYGFLFAYILVAIASPVYLWREHQLRAVDILYSVLAVVFMVIPAIGSVGIPGENSLFPVPAAPYNIFPYLFLLYLVVGGGWFIMLRLRRPEIIEQMENDLEAVHTRFGDMKKV